MMATRMTLLCYATLIHRNLKYNMLDTKAKGKSSGCLKVGKISRCRGRVLARVTEISHMPIKMRE